MSDLFHARVPLEYVREVFAVMADTPRHTYLLLTKRSTRMRRVASQLDWPRNLWVGVSVETGGELYRVADLAAVPAAVRFVSAEPLLGSLAGINLEHVDWLIAGGESGPGHRPVDPAWVRELRDHCSAHDTAFFFKQWGGRTSKTGGRSLDGRTWNQMPDPTARDAATGHPRNGTKR